MLDDLIFREEPLSSDMQILLNEYPREAWEEHPNFKDATRQWLRAHQMFRRLSEIVRVDTEHYLDKKLDAETYASKLSTYGSRLVGNLHGHHGWEDHEFFPELSKADHRFDSGLEILEKDHEVLDAVLNRFTKSANSLIQMQQLDEVAARDFVGEVHETSEAIENLLSRHLVDEEELAVPIIIHHKLRG